MKINEDTSTYKPPFTVVLLDAYDAYYYADVMGGMEEVTKEENLEKAIAIADALFREKNKGWTSLQAMNDVDGGYDERVYDSTFSCVYAAHTKYIENWIDKTPATVLPDVSEKAYKEDTKSFKVFCDDMFHYQDEDERFLAGEFATRDEAIQKCQIILMESLQSLYEPGMTESELTAKWWSFGDDPWVSFPSDNPDDIPFSAAKEVQAFAQHIIEQKEKELTNNK